MHGHLPLIEMRRNRIRPKSVFINDFPDPTSKDWNDPGRKYRERWSPDHPSICVSGDEISSLDLSFVVGLTVHISSTSESRAKELFQLAIDNNAKIIAACHIKEDQTPSDPMGWFEIYRKEEVTNG